MVGEMVQNSQIQYSFTFNDFIVVHEYIHSHSTTTLLLVIYTNSDSTTSFLVTNIFIYIPDALYHSLSRSNFLFNKVAIRHSTFCAHLLLRTGSQALTRSIFWKQVTTFFLATKVNNMADDERPNKRENK